MRITRHPGSAREQEPGGGRARPAPRPGPSRTAPLSHVLLCLLVVSLGIVMGVQSVSGDAGPRAVQPSAAAPAPDAPAVDPLVAVANSILLRAAFSGLPFQASGPGETRPAGAGGLSRLAPSIVRRPALPDPSSNVVPGTWATLWAAYERAARRAPTSCNLPTSLLAAIGHVESGSLAGRRLNPDGDVVPPVLGPVLSGGRFAAIRDTDDGLWDGDRTWDRAVGPMQFIPGTWRVWGSDGSGDGIANPQNLDDAVFSAARYLCAGNRDLSRSEGLQAAILAYNRSSSYLATVLAVMRTIGPESLPYLPSAPALAVRPSATATSVAPSPTPASAPTTSTPALPTTTSSTAATTTGTSEATATPTATQTSSPSAPSADAPAAPTTTPTGTTSPTPTPSSAPATSTPTG